MPIIIATLIFLAGLFIGAGIATITITLSTVVDDEKTQ